MLIQLVLTIALIGYGVYALYQHRTSAVVSSLSIVACVAGLVLVWDPNLANVLAHMAGVGRGADLVFYVFIAVSGFIGLYLHLRVDESLRVTTQLARAMALRSPLRPNLIAEVQTEVHSGPPAAHVAKHQPLS